MKKKLAVASAAAIGITALVLDTDFNPAAVADAVGAECEMQKKIAVGYAHAKASHAFIKYLLLRDDQDLNEFSVWLNDTEAYLLGFYLKEHRKNYEKRLKEIEV